MPLPGDSDRVLATVSDRLLPGEPGRILGLLTGTPDWALVGEPGAPLGVLAGDVERDLVGDSACPSAESCTTAAARTRCQTVDTSCKTEDLGQDALVWLGKPGLIWLPKFLCIG